MSTPQAIDSQQVMHDDAPRMVRRRPPPTRRASRCGRAALVCAASFAAIAGPASAATHSTAVPTTLPAGNCNQTPATPYPSQIVVSEETGVISDVNVTFNRLTTGSPHATRALLVAPSGAAVILWSSPFAFPAVSDVTFTFDESGNGIFANGHPVEGGVYGTVGNQNTFCLNVHSYATSLPSPAPPASYDDSLNELNGGDPNGTWSLYLVSDAAQGAGDLEGWSLDITTEEPGADYAETVLEHSPAGYWRFGEEAGTTAFDSSVNGNDGTYLNGPQLGVPGALAGDEDTAVLMDGTNDIVRVPDDPTLDVGASFTAEGWIKRSSDTKTHQLMNKGRNGLHLVVTASTSGNQVHLRKADVTTIARSDIEGGVPADDAYHHVVATMDGTPGSARIYIDGEEAETVQITTATIQDTAIGLLFGTAASNPAAFDEFALYDDALSAEQVAEHYAAGAGVGADAAF